MQRVAVRLGGLGEQCPVDVEQQQQHPRAASAHRSNDIPGLQPASKAGDQLGRDLDVVQRDQLDRRVHVAQGHRHQPGGDPGAAGVNGIGVGAGPAAQRLDGELDLLLLGDVVQQVRHLRVKRGPAGDHRPRPQRVLGDRPQLDAGLIGGVGHVDDDGHDRGPGRRRWSARPRRSSPPGPPRVPARRRARLRPAPPVGRPPRPRSSRCGCRARGTPAARWAVPPAPRRSRRRRRSAPARGPRPRPWRRCRCGGP